ncbi:MAG TPA: hypothetical protein DCZ40_00470 [Lachnospiraceae bacterium]|nr:hypothetical protein [Lachnospiraceae bacterium]
MEALISLIQKYNNNDNSAGNLITARMTPLVRKYAAKLHCMEYDDAIQELYLSLLESLRYIDTAQSEGRCVRYMETCVVNRYRTLCKHYLSDPQTENLDNFEMTLSAPEPYDDSQTDIDYYIRTLPSTGYKHQILSLFFYEDLNDNEIASRLHLSRQYVNRVKKKLIRDYFSQNT